LINFIIDNDSKSNYMYKERGVVTIRDYPSDGEFYTFYYKKAHEKVRTDPDLLIYLRVLVDTLWESSHGDGNDQETI